jgi:hypothetical protein
MNLNWLNGSEPSHSVNHEWIVTLLMYIGVYCRRHRNGFRNLNLC